MTFIDDDKLRKSLRAPFPREQIGKLPQALSKDAQKGRCSECGGWHKLPAVHLDYVGHAAVTDRLNHEAPDWTYRIDHIERDKDGHVTGILATMTIGGKSLPESGTPDKRTDFGEEMKLAISDFIRRGAMRFGVALDLWAKEDLLVGQAGADDRTGAGDSAASPSPPSGSPPAPEETRMGKARSSSGAGSSPGAGTPGPPRLATTRRETVSAAQGSRPREEDAPDDAEVVAWYRTIHAEAAKLGWDHDELKRQLKPVEPNTWSMQGLDAEQRDVCLRYVRKKVMAAEGGAA